jgi:hypothetical protein
MRVAHCNLIWVTKPHITQQLHNLVLRRLARYVAVSRQYISNLRPYREMWCQRLARILGDQRNLGAPHLLQFSLRQRKEIDTFTAHRPLHAGAIPANIPQQRQGQGTFAASRLTDNAEAFAWHQLQRHIVDGRHRRPIWPTKSNR